MDVYRKRKLQLLLQRKDVDFLVDAAASMTLKDDVEEVRKRSRLRARQLQEHDASPLSTIVDYPMAEEDEEEDDRRKRKVPASTSTSGQPFQSTVSKAV